MERPLGFENWETLYKKEDVKKMPWYLPGLDHDFERALKMKKIRSGDVLELGAGPGTQSITLAERGFRVVGTDISATAVKKAAQAARKKGVTVKFRRDDIVHTRLKKPVDVIFDRGCFHVLSDAERKIYVRHAARLLKKGGFLFLKTFSVKQKGDWGPHRFKPADIRRFFSPKLAVLSVKESVFRGSFKPDPRALFCVIQKR